MTWAPDSFSGNDGDKTIAVRGIPTAPASRAGFLQPIHTDEVTAYDAKLALEMALGGIKAHREANVGNISDLGFKYLNIFLNEAE